MTAYRCNHCSRTVPVWQINTTDLNLNASGKLDRLMACPYCHNYSLEESK